MWVWSLDLRIGVWWSGSRARGESWRVGVKCSVFSVWGLGVRVWDLGYKV